MKSVQYTYPKSGGKSITYKHSGVTSFDRNQGQEPATVIGKLKKGNAVNMAGCKSQVKKHTSSGRGQ